jgi:glycosyltransferase involved in cell wall biosynthesis
MQVIRLQLRGCLLPSILRPDMKHGNTGPGTAPLTIAIDGNFLAMPYSGIGTYLRGLLDALQADADVLGVDVQLLSPSDGRFLRPGTRAHRFAWDAVGVTGQLLRTAGPRPQVLHLPQMSAPLWSPIPMVVTIHDVIPFVLEDYRSSRAMRAYLALMARSARRGRRVIVPSESARIDVQQVLGIHPDRIRVIPEAAGPDLVPSRDSEAVARVRERWGLEGRYLFNIGGFDRRKNLPMLIEAFAAARSSLPEEVKLVIAGAPHTANSLVFPPLGPLIRKHGLEESVILTGRVANEERRSLYQAAHAYITPSIYEGFGLTPLEAMACGVPAIVANRTSLPEVVGKAGLVVEPEVDDLAAAIRALMTDDDLRVRLAAASLERAGTFTWANAARSTAAVYHEVIAADGPQT